MTLQEKEKVVKNHLIMNEGITDPAKLDEEIAKLAAACPEATAKDKGLTEVIDKAYETVMIQTGQAGAAPAAPTDVKNTVVTAPTAKLSAEEELHIAKTLTAQNESRTMASTTTAIDKLVLDRPDPHDYIPAGTKGMIKKKGFENLLAKINDGTYKLCADDGENIDAEKRIASTTNFNALKAAYENGTPVDVRIGNLSTKPIGYLVRKGNVVGTDTAPQQMTREGLERYLVMETNGFILASDGKPGAKLRYVNSQTSATDIGNSKQGHTVVADTNKKETIEAGSYVVSRVAEGETKNQVCKSELAFKVIDTTKPARDNGDPVYRTIRVSVEVALPTLVRLPEFIDVFGTGERDANADLKVAPTGDAASKITQAQINAIAELRQKAAIPEIMRNYVDIADKLAAFDVKSNAPTGVTV